MQKKVCGLCLVLMLLFATNVWAQGVYTEDTAPNRQDNAWGTPAREGRDITVTTNERGESVTTVTPEKKEPVDWYDKIFITADPVIIEEK